MHVQSVCPRVSLRAFRPLGLQPSDRFSKKVAKRSKWDTRRLREFCGSDWAFRQMPQDLLEGLASREGKKILEEIWPDIVNAYFKALSNPQPSK